MLTQLLPLGELAPNFRLHATPDQSVSLSDLRGLKVVLVFYPADRSPVCTDQLTLFNETLEYLRKLRGVVVGISVDGVWSHNAFSAPRNFHFPLLADFEPKGEVSNAYRVFNLDTGQRHRTIYIIGERGFIRCERVAPKDSPLC